MKKQIFPSTASAILLSVVVFLLPLQSIAKNNCQGLHGRDRSDCVREQRMSNRNERDSDHEPQSSSSFTSSSSEQSDRNECKDAEKIFRSYQMEKLREWRRERRMRHGRQELLMQLRRRMNEERKAFHEQVKRGQCEIPESSSSSSSSSASSTSSDASSSISSSSQSSS